MLKGMAQNVLFVFIWLRMSQWNRSRCWTVLMLLIVDVHRFGMMWN